VVPGPSEYEAMFHVFHRIVKYKCAFLFVTSYNKQTIPNNSAENLEQILCKHLMLQRRVVLQDVLLMKCILHCLRSVIIYLWTKC